MLAACRPRQASCLSSNRAMAASVCMKFCTVTRMLPQNFAWSKFLFGLSQPFQFLEDFAYPQMFGKTQWPATNRCKTGSQNHSVIRILGRIDDSLFHATSGLIHHQKDEPVSQLLF